MGQGCGSDCGCAPCRAASVESQPVIGARDIGEVFRVMPGIARQAEGIVNTGWQAAKPFVPYGETIDSVVQPIRRAAGLGGATLDASAIREAQQVTRAARRGDPAAKERYREVKAAGGARWRIYVAAARDDQRRIDALTRAGSAS